jgi:hypothetical protein
MIGVVVNGVVVIDVVDDDVVDDDNGNVFGDATESGDVDADGKNEDSLLVSSIEFPLAALCKHSLYHNNSHIISDKNTSSMHIHNPLLI